MIQILRKYNKKILAVIGVFLMIAFIVPSVAKRGGPHGRQAFGQIGNHPITDSEFRRAYESWQALHSRGATFSQMIGFTPDGQPQYATLSLMELQLAGKLMPLFMSENPMLGYREALNQAQSLVHRIDATTFLLLLKEAQQMNIRANRDLVQQILAAMQQLPTDDPELREQAVTDWLLVMEAFERVANATKVSQAMGIQQLAREDQQVATKLVEFKAINYKSQVPPPTNEQLEAFFQKYRTVSPADSDTGFGYKYPNRVKLEYVKVPRAKLREKISDEDTYKFWKDNQQLFPSTQPTEEAAATTQPAGPPTTLPAQAASTRPTTRPWAEVKEQIRDRQANELAALMAKNIRQLMSSDWGTYRIATGNGASPTTAPSNANTTSSLAVPYNTYVYLQRLQASIQARKDSRSVLPELVSEGEWLSKEDLAKLPGIGQSALMVTDGRWVGFSDFLFERASAFLTETQRKQAQENRVDLLASYQPSLPFRDAEGNYYIVRITAADPSHAPATLAEVEKQVREDWITAQAYEKAQQAARKFLDDAKAQGIDAAAKAAGDLPVTATSPFVENPRFPIGNLNLPANSRPKFVEGAFALFRERLKTGNPNPMGVIELPKAATAIVAQVTDAKPAIQHEQFEQQVAAMQRDIQNQHEGAMALRWFWPEAIQKRMDFRAPPQRKSSEPADTPAAPPLLTAAPTIQPLQAHGPRRGLSFPPSPTPGH